MGTGALTLLVERCVLVVENWWEGTGSAGRQSR
jgi:hypothetical protein